MKSYTYIKNANKTKKCNQKKREKKKKTKKSL